MKCRAGPHRGDSKKFTTLERVALTRARSCEAPRALATGFVGIIAGLLVGCGDAGGPSLGASDVGTNLDIPGITDTEAGPDVPAGGDAEGPSPECESNRDCAGGEACRDGTCRLVCASSDECEPTAPVCDVAVGFCVACLTADDCGPNETCLDNTCAFFCREDEACPEDSYCDFGSGTCAVRECERSADCEGGFRCERYTCQPIDPIVCEAEVIRCEGDSVATCNADGTRRTLVPCGEGQRCVAAEASASCADVVCEPNAIGCDDDVTAFECDGTGTVRTVTTCPGVQICVGGACRSFSCVPGATRCDGDGVQTCAADGLSEVWTSCASDPDCVSRPEGCVCRDDACQPRVCMPGSTRCAGVGAQTCADDGLSWGTSVACAGDEICSAELGDCVPLTCTSGERTCFGEVLGTCAASGDAWTSTDCRDQNAYCELSEGGATCVAVVCEPLSTTCDRATNSVVSCDARGSVASAVQCPADTTCVRGECVEGPPPCPTPVIRGLPGVEVLPGTTLNLSARGSTSENGAVVEWEWSVEQPDGSVSQFFPAADRQDVTFVANVVGEYRFRLKVWDELGVESCDAAEVMVNVTPGDGIFVELFWHTPGDEDETDVGFDFFGESVGTDLDLHFLHPNANSQYFHSQYDCNWLNTNPNWRGAGTGDNPRLVRDDTDGAGPELISLVVPEAGATYRVGAHFWDDWGFGVSFATVRVHVYGELVHEWSDVELNNRDLWDAIEIGPWPEGTVTRIQTNGGPSITPNFSSPLFP